MRENKVIQPTVFIALMLLLNIVFLNTYAQSPNWIWSKTANYDPNHTGNGSECVTTDPDGNIICVGFFSSADISFGTYTLSNSSNYSDFFIVKYDSTGNVLWAKSGGGSNTEEINWVTTDANGNIYVAGLYKSSPLTIGTTTLSNVNLNQNMFVAKYDNLGNVLWAKSAGNAGNDGASGVAVDAVGNVFVTGIHQGITFGTNVIFNAGATDIFVVKYDTMGNLVWSKGFGGTAADFVSSICTDSAGNVILAGAFRSPTINFGNITLSSVTFDDIFITKMDTQGNIIFAKAIGGDGYDRVNNIVSDHNGNFYVTGDFGSTQLSFDTITITKFPSDIQFSDVFCAKYDVAGNAVWVKRAGAGASESASAISIDNFDNVYIIGNYQDTTFTFGSQTITNTGQIDLFVAKYDTQGNEIWVKGTGQEVYTYSKTLALDNSGNIYTSGIFGIYNYPDSSSIAFGIDTLTVESGVGMFLAKLGQSEIVAIKNINDKPLFNIYPNPTQALLHVDGAGNNISPSQIKLFRVDGTEVFIPKYQNTLDISHLSTGVYFIQMRDEHEIFIKKIIKQ